MLNAEQKKILMDHVDMLCKQIDKMNKKGDITPDELKRSGEVFDVLKDFETICAMEEYGKDPEEEMYSSMGYYGRNSRTATPYVYDPMRDMPMHSSQVRDSMGRYSSTGYSSASSAKQSMRQELEMKMANARNEEERQMYMNMMDSLNR